MDPWDRQKGEPARFYAAFRWWLETPGANLRDVAKEFDRAYNTVRKWRDTWKWGRRREAYCLRRAERLERLAEERFLECAESMLDKLMDPEAAKSVPGLLRKWQTGTVPGGQTDKGALQVSVRERVEAMRLELQLMGVLSDRRDGKTDEAVDGSITVNIINALSPSDVQPKDHDPEALSDPLGLDMEPGDDG